MTPHSHSDSLEVLTHGTCSNKKRNLENIAAGEIVLSEAELAEIDSILAKTPVMGSRYSDNVDPKLMQLWG